MASSRRRLLGEPPRLGKIGGPTLFLPPSMKVACAKIGGNAQHTRSLIYVGRQSAGNDGKTAVPYRKALFGHGPSHDAKP